MSEDARVTLRCPDCGAPLPPTAATAAVTCAQCGATSKPAPKGPERIVQTIVVERVVVKEGDRIVDTSISCPRCKVALFTAQARDVTLQGCGVCGGIWLDNEGSVAITRHADPRVGVLAARAEASATVRASMIREELACPICHAHMRKVNPSKLAELDVCAEHGTWFDAGELRRVMNAYTGRDDDPFAAIDAKGKVIDPNPLPSGWTVEEEPIDMTFGRPTVGGVLRDGALALGEIGVGILGAMIAGGASNKS